MTIRLALLTSLACMVACAHPMPRVSDARLVDLSHGYDGETIYWPTEPDFELDVEAAGMTEGGYYYAANRFASAEHGGTHLDAPRHFAEGRHTVEEIPIETLVGSAIRVDVREACAADRDYRVTVDDFMAWEQAHGRIRPGTIVLIDTGFAAFWPDRLAYLGTAGRGKAAVAELSFPGLGADAARWLVEQRGIAAVGLDTASIDYGKSTGFETHRILMQANVPAFENLTGLEGLPASGFEVVALPMKIVGGSGAPLRAIAVVPPGS